MGYYGPIYGERACLWQGEDNTLIDLASYLPQYTRENAYSSRALAIDVAGDDIWITGYANVDAGPRAVLWHYSTVPEPSGIIALLAGLGGFAFWRRK